MKKISIFLSLILFSLSIIAGSCAHQAESRAQQAESRAQQAESRAQQDVKISCNVEHAEIIFKTVHENVYNNFIRGELQIESLEPFRPKNFNNEESVPNVDTTSNKYVFIMFKKKGYRDYINVLKIKPLIETRWYPIRGPWFFPFTPKWKVFPTVFIPFGAPQFRQERKGMFKKMALIQFISGVTVGGLFYVTQNAKQDFKDARKEYESASAGGLDNARDLRDKKMDIYHQHLDNTNISITVFAMLYGWQIFDGIFRAPGSKTDPRDISLNISPDSYRITAILKFNL